MSFRRIASRVLLAAVAGATLLSAAPAHSGEWIYPLYGYRPRVYGSWPSAYVYPRYGFHHGDIYTTHIGYGEPGFGQRAPGQAGAGAALGEGQSNPGCDPAAGAEALPPAQME
ncbi:MAG TPA: hypothetical protein VHY20_07160 [Pirellulales bacterium]|jgi:hypothetical protein|nr:hypothetical protein [Pirellulales bacterium]